MRPLKQKKMMMKWIGTFEVINKIGESDCKVKLMVESKLTTSICGTNIATEKEVKSTLWQIMLLLLW